MKKPKYKIFEKDTVLECLKKCFKEGYRPLFYNELQKWIFETKDNQWFISGTVNVKEKYYWELREDIELLKKIVKTPEAYRGQLLFLYYDWDGLDGDLDLDSDGRFVGVLDK